MLQAGCIYLGLINPCPETFHPPTPAQKTYCPLSRNFPPPTPAQKTYHSLPNYRCRLNKRILKKSRLINVSLIASTNLPISMKPPWSLSALSLVVRPTVAPPCLNKVTPTSAEVVFPFLPRLNRTLHFHCVQLLEKGNQSLYMLVTWANLSLHVGLQNSSADTFCPWPAFLLTELPRKPPWTEEPGGSQSRGSQRVRHDWEAEHSTVFLQTQGPNSGTQGWDSASWNQCLFTFS